MSKLKLRPDGRYQMNVYLGFKDGKKSTKQYTGKPRKRRKQKPINLGSPSKKGWIYWPRAIPSEPGRMPGWK